VICYIERTRERLKERDAKKGVFTGQLAIPLRECVCVCVCECLVKPQADLKTNTRASLWSDECVERVSREQSRANERK